MADRADDGWSPAVDIYETDQEVVLVAELAGIRREDIKVMVEGSVVRIYGHRSPSFQGRQARFHRVEIASGAFVRSFRIGVPFDPAGIQARAEDGMLLITLPKSAHHPQRTIAVENG